MTVLKIISNSKSYCDTEAVANFFTESSIVGLSDNDGQMPYNLHSLTKQGAYTLHDDNNETTRF